MSLSTRLALFASLLVIATSVIIGVALTQTATDDLYADLEARGMAIARGLAIRAAPLVEQNSPEALQRLLESFWEERDVARIEVVGLDGDLLASHNLGLSPATIDNAVVMYIVSSPPDDKGYRDGLGAIRVTLSAEGVEARRSRYVHNALRLSFGVAGVGILIAILVGVLLAMPLGRLSKSAGSVAAGNYHDALTKLGVIPSRSGPEVRQLSEALIHAVEAVAAREKELTAVNTLLRRTEAARDSMTHMVIHDLKGPIGNVVTLMGLLDTERLTLDDQDLISEVAQRSRALLRRIEEQLEQARGVDADFQVQREPTSIPSLIDQALDHTNHLAIDANFEIIRNVPDTLPPLQCDGPVMVRVLENLIGNALRYGASPILISAHSHPNTLEFTVEDHGPGVPDERVDLVFERFQSFVPDDPDRRLGSGLGLAFVKAAIEAHNGSVRVKGSRFSLHLPIETQGV